ncbi:unnamed protein product, partial [Agarophyton chilense]
MAFVSSVHCRFGIRIPKAGGLCNFIRIVEQGSADVDVEKRQSMLLSKPRVSGKGRKSVWDGWIPNPKSSAEENQYGSYVVYTLLPCLEGAVTEDLVQNGGVYLTITERIVRAYTTLRANKALFYEYVAPLNPMDTTAVRTVFLTFGCSIVLPCTYAVRIGGHEMLSVQIVGYVVRVERMEKEEYSFYDKVRIRAAENLYECCSDVGYLERNEDGTESKVEFDILRDNRSRKYVVGSIPTMLNIEINNKFRESLVQKMYDVLPGATNLCEVYNLNPILRVDGEGSISM